MEGEKGRGGVPGLVDARTTVGPPAKSYVHETAGREGRREKPGLFPPQKPLHSPV